MKFPLELSAEQEKVGWNGSSPLKGRGYRIVGPVPLLSGQFLPSRVVTRASRPLGMRALFLFHSGTFGTLESGPFLAKLGGNTEVHGFRPKGEQPWTFSICLGS
ncbi:hypothetical protein CEB3_c28610 [Peptococcaceae bacterium CEB3]|nr:hypothetical protein CEB3_c28610 [Peptococcaceae bacterium CEB3]